MDRLGTQTKRITVRSESYVIALCFVATAAIAEGAIVKLNSDGTVSAYTGASGEVPFGSVAVGCTKANEEVTVNTQFVAEVNATATAAIAGAGVLLSVNKATIGGKEVTGYKTNAAGEYVVAIALGSAVQGGSVRVGVLRTFSKTAGA